MTRVQEIRIAALEGLTIPDNIREGSELTIIAKLLVSSVEQEWVDVTMYAGKPEQVPGSTTIHTVARDWTAE